MLSIIGVIALFFIGKFVYDTFLTNNTERDWNEYERSHPNQAKVLETNKGLNFKTNYDVRKDGVYFWVLNGTSDWRGCEFTITFYIHFNHLNRVFFTDVEGDKPITSLEAGEMIKHFKANEHRELSRSYMDYTINRGEIRMDNLDSNGCGEVYQGLVIKDGLILSQTGHCFDYSLDAMSTEVEITDMKFEFVKATYL